MVVLFESECLKECLKINQTKSLTQIKVKKFYDIIYNDATQILFSKKYIAYLEKFIPDQEVFEALVKELSDKNSLKIVETSHAININDEFVAMYKSCNSTYIFPVSIDDDLEYLQFEEENFVKIKSTTIKYKVINSLLTKGIYSTSYQDFSSDLEINNFFKEVFSIPRLINKAMIFDREVQSNYMIGLKGKLIFYYTLTKPNDRYFLADAKEELKALGSKVKLYSTRDPRQLHERKIIIDGLIITPDNSFKNLTVKEPTWDINIAYNSEKANSWLTKCSKFKEVK